MSTHYYLPKILHESYLHAFYDRSTEPTILALIIANAVVLIIQSARSLTLPDPDEPPSRVRGYFHTWEDWALFGLFIIFTYVFLLLSRSKYMLIVAAG